MTDNGAQRFADRLALAANRAARNPGWKIEVVKESFRITYTFTLEGRFYTHENLTTFRAVAHSQQNALLMAMNDLMDSVEKFKMANHV